jgi:hypothetical protein
MCVELHNIFNTENIQALTILIGTFTAGCWTYSLFVLQRLKYPKVNVSIEINTIELEHQKRLIHTEIKIENIGSILLKSNYAELRLRQIYPLKPEILDIIKEGYDPVNKDKSQIFWPCLVQREWENSLEIEPNEKDYLYADFFIDINIQAIELYFFIQNPKKNKDKNKGEDKGIGWTLTKFYNFSKEDQMANQNSQNLDEQQKQQPQQPNKKKWLFIKFADQGKHI